MDKKKIEDWLQEIAILATRYNSVRKCGELRTVEYFIGTIQCEASKPQIHLPHDVFKNIVSVLDISVTMDDGDGYFELYFEMYDCYFFSFYKERKKDGKDK